MTKKTASVLRTIERYKVPPNSDLGDGYEEVTINGSTSCRLKLSSAGRRRHERLEGLIGLGYEVLSSRGAGMVYHPRVEEHLFSIAAAAHTEGLD